MVNNINFADVKKKLTWNASRHLWYYEII